MTNVTAVIDREDAEAALTVIVNATLAAAENGSPRRHIDRLKRVAVALRSAIDESEGAI